MGVTSLPCLQHIGDVLPHLELSFARHRALWLGSNKALRHELIINRITQVFELSTCLAAVLGSLWGTQCSVHMGWSSHRVSCLGWVCTRVLETAPPELCTKGTRLQVSPVWILLLFAAGSCGEAEPESAAIGILAARQADAASRAERCPQSGCQHHAPTSSLGLSAAFSLPGEHTVYNCKWANIRSLNSKIRAGGLVIRFELKVLTAKGSCWFFGFFCVGGRWWEQGGSFSISLCCPYSLLPPFNSSNSLINMIKQSLAWGWWDVTLCSFGQRPQPSFGQAKLLLTGRGAPNLQSSLLGWPGQLLLENLQTDITQGSWEAAVVAGREVPLTPRHWGCAQRAGEALSQPKVNVATASGRGF